MEEPKCPIAAYDESFRTPGDSKAEIQDFSELSVAAQHTLNLLVRTMKLSEEDLSNDERLIPYELFTQLLTRQMLAYAQYMLDTNESGKKFDRDTFMRFVTSSISPDADELPPLAFAAVQAFEPGSRSKADGTSFDKKVGTRLSKARSIAGMSIEESSRELRISPQALYKYEKGERTIKAKLVYDAARLYAVDGNWLLCLTDVLHVTKKDEDGFLVTMTYRDAEPEGRNRLHKSTSAE